MNWTWMKFMEYFSMIAADEALIVIFFSIYMLYRNCKKSAFLPLGSNGPITLATSTCYFSKIKSSLLLLLLGVTNPLSTIR